jgi:hypothetical protein
MQVRRRTGLALAVMAALAPGCAELAAPEWAYFDTDRHPVGGIPAQVGFYAGEFVVYPCTLILVSLFTMGRSDVHASTSGMKGMGVVTGIVVGAPFHLVALPFGSSGEEGEESDPLPEPPAREDELKGW